MVKICSNTYTNNTYEEYFNSYLFELSDFQKYAIEGIIENKNVLVTAHTGSGKTLPAEFAIEHFAKQGKKVIYTSPIKALSNQKYYDFCNKFPNISFGLFTGDIKTNPDADVLIMTTEILMNYLFFQEADQVNVTDFTINIQSELGCVVFDEVHYINDKERGQVWEKTILMLPNHIQMIMLSATIDNPEGFANWVEESSQKEVYLCSTNKRVVPLYHYSFFTTIEHTFKVITDKATQQKIRKHNNALIPLQNEKNVFNSDNYKLLQQLHQYHYKNRIYIKTPHVLNSLVKMLKNENKLPAICFVFSRKKVESYASMIHTPVLSEDDDHPNMEKECLQIIRKLPNYKEYIKLSEYNQLVSLLQKGIGIHHSGMIPILKEIVELMISKKYIKVLFATESFAIGLDCPIKSAVFVDLNKFDGSQPRNLHSHEYTQMAGRAGRRGLDKIGYVIHCNNCFSFPYEHQYKNIMNGVPQKLVSKYIISYALLLNLLKNGVTNDFHLFSEKSMMRNEIANVVTEKENTINRTKLRIEELRNQVHNNKTPIDVCIEYIDFKENIKSYKSKKQKEIQRKINEYEDMYKTIKKDVIDYDLFIEYESSLSNLDEELYQSTHYIEQQTNLVCKIMIRYGFIEHEDNKYQLTQLGTIATHLAEIHPLINAEFVVKWNNFKDFSSIQLVGLFSCFMDIRVSDEYKCVGPNCNDEFLYNRLVEYEKRYLEYNDIEVEYELYIYNYETALMFDLVELSMEWCYCENETDCKDFIELRLSKLDISLGDFNKGLLKIVTISKEFIKLFTYLGEVESLHKFTEIEKYLLKYVTTSQSLYV
tara:strand:+ start:1246 stop:3705 length:2460 start_codon:yes stop_codon:yes gene_type:complete